jgi:hypothetical protein
MLLWDALTPDRREELLRVLGRMLDDRLDHRADPAGEVAHERH